MKLKTPIIVMFLFFFLGGAAYGADIIAYADLKRAINESAAGAKAKSVLAGAAKNESANSFNNLKSQIERVIVKELLGTLAKISPRTRYSKIYSYLGERKYQDLVSGVIVENISDGTAVDLTPDLIREFNKRQEIIEALIYDRPYLNIDKIENEKKEILKRNEESAKKTVEANEAFFKGDFKAALDAHSEAFKLREKNNDSFSMATSASNIATNYYQLRNFAESRIWAIRAKELSVLSGNNVVLGSSISLQAGIEVQNGRFADAVEDYKEAIDIFKKAEEAYARLKIDFTDEELLARLNITRAQINDTLKNLYSHKSNAILSLGLAYSFLDDHKNATSSLKKFSEENGFSFVPSIMLESYKTLYEAALSYAEGCELFDQGAYEGAMTRFRRAQELYIGATVLGSSVGVVASLKKIGDIHLKQNRTVEAAAHYRQALEISDKTTPALSRKYDLEKLILNAETELKK